MGACPEGGFAIFTFYKIMQVKIGKKIYSYVYMDDSNDFLIDKLMEFITEENIDEKLLFYSSILQRLMDKKECMDININSSVKQRACKKRN